MSLCEWNPRAGPKIVPDPEGVEQPTVVAPLQGANLYLPSTQGSAEAAAPWALMLVADGDRKLLPKREPLFRKNKERPPESAASLACRVGAKLRLCASRFRV